MRNMHILVFSVCLQLVLALMALADSGPSDPRKKPTVEGKSNESPDSGCPELDHRCKEVTLAPLAQGVTVSLMRGGVRMSFGLEDFKKKAVERRDKKLVEWLGKNEGKDVNISLKKLPAGVRHEAVIFAAAALLEEGKAALYDTKKKRRAKRVIVQQWNWIGCAGGCRQAGREFRLSVPGRPFLRTTDIYEDGEPGTFKP